MNCLEAQLAAPDPASATPAPAAVRPGPDSMVRPRAEASAAIDVLAIARGALLKRAVVVIAAAAVAAVLVWLILSRAA